MNAEPRTLDHGVAPFKKLLLEVCGFCFENEREAVLKAGLKRRMSSRKVESGAEYLGLVAREPDEMLRLVELLTVNETYFLREPDHLRLLTQVLIPEIQAKRPHGPVTMVSAGCSTGEEPYSLAMLLRDLHGEDSAGLFRITGVDIDETVLAGARRGVYGKHSFRGLDPSCLERHFEPSCDGGWRLKPEVRRLVSFESVNLRAPEYPPFMRDLDIILYRNVSIYFPEQVQKEIFRRLAACLNEGGYLLLGATETLPHDIGLLTLREKDRLYVYHKPPGDPFNGRRKPVSARGAQPGADRRAQGTTDKARPGPGQRAPQARPSSASSPAPPLASPISMAKVRDLLTEALRLAKDGLEGQAQALVDDLLARDGSLAAAHCLKASILMNGLRPDEAKKACRQALSLDPNRQEASLMLGLIALQEGETEEAVRLLREAVYLDPTCWLGQFHLAEIMFAQAEKKRARGGYETALRLLTSDLSGEGRQRFFPLSYNPAPYMTVCRHKLALLKS